MWLWTKSFLKIVSCVFIILSAFFRQFVFEQNDTRVSEDVKTTLVLFNRLYAHIQKKKQDCVDRNCVYSTEGLPGLLKHIVYKSLRNDPEKAAQVDYTAKYARK